MLKKHSRITPQIMNEVIPRNCALNYNLHLHPEFASRAISTVYYGSELLRFLGPKIWEMLPLDMKNSDSLDSFKSEIKKWRPQECIFRLCKSYVHQVDFTKI